MNEIIEEIGINAVSLSLELERAVIEHVLQEDEGIYITEDGWYPCWVRILKKSGFVGFSTYIMFRKTSTHLQKLEIANRFNKRNYMTSTFVDGQKLIIDHAINFRGGMLTANFIRACRIYATSIGNSISDIDPDFRVLMPVGETESEGTENE